MKDIESSILTVTTRILVCVLVMFMLSIIVRFGVQQVFIEKMNIDNAFTRLVLWDQEKVQGPVTNDIDWQKLYPFKETISPELVKSRHLPFTQLIERYKDIISANKSKINIYTTELLMFHNYINEYANAYNGLLGWEMNPTDGYNNVIIMNDGYLAGYGPKKDVEPQIESMSSLSDFLKQSNIDLLYVQVPSKVNINDTDIDGTVDFTNQNIEKLIAGLNKKGIDCLDLREAMLKDGRNFHEFFYRTDHHWKAETGLWATGVLCNYLNSNYGYRIDTSLFDSNNYTYDVYKDWFLGSQGKKITLSRTSPEDITLIYPKFYVCFSLRIPSLSLDVTGKFNIIYSYPEIETKDYYNKNPYGAYIYGDNALTCFSNNLLKDGRKILIIGDSNDNSLVPFFALGVQYIDSIDLRYFTGSLHSFIEQNGYNMVIIIYNPSAIGKIDYSNHKCLFDFR